MTDDEVQTTRHGGTRIQAKAPARRPVVEFVPADREAETQGGVGKGSMTPPDATPLPKPPVPAPYEESPEPRDALQEARDLLGAVRSRTDRFLEELGKRLRAFDPREARTHTWTSTHGNPPPTPPTTETHPPLVPMLNEQATRTSPGFEVLDYGPPEKDGSAEIVPVQVQEANTSAPPAPPPFDHVSPPFPLNPATVLTPEDRSEPELTHPPPPPSRSKEAVPMSSTNEAGSDEEDGLLAKLQSRFKSDPGQKQEDASPEEASSADEEDQDEDQSGLLGRLKGRFGREPEAGDEAEEAPEDEPARADEPEPTPEEAKEQEDPTEAEEEPDEDEAPAQEPTGLEPEPEEDVDLDPVTDHDATQPPAPPTDQDPLPTTMASDDDSTTPSTRPRPQHATRSLPSHGPAPTPPASSQRIPGRIRAGGSSKADAERREALRERVDDVLDRYEEPPSRPRVEGGTRQR